MEAKYNQESRDYVNTGWEQGISTTVNVVSQFLFDPLNAADFASLGLKTAVKLGAMATTGYVTGKVIRNVAKKVGSESIAHAAEEIGEKAAKTAAEIGENVASHGVIDGAEKVAQETAQDAPKMAPSPGQGSASPLVTDQADNVGGNLSLLTDEAGVGKKINGAVDDVAEVGKGLNDNLYDGNFQGLVVTEHTGADGLLIRKINNRPIPQRQAPTEESIREFLGHNLGFDMTKLDPQNLTPEQEAFVRLGPGYHDGFTMESFFKQPPDRQGQLIIDPRLLSDSRMKMGPAEIAVAEYLASLGNTVECHFYSGNLKMGDFLVNGVRVELKTLTDLQGYPSLEHLAEKIGGKVNKGRQQAYHIIMDTRKYSDANANVLDGALYYARTKDENKHIKQVLFISTDGARVGHVHVKGVK